MLLAPEIDDFYNYFWFAHTCLLSFLLQVQKEFSFANVDRQFHLIAIGEMIEDKENQMRNELSEIYFGKV